MKQSKNIVLESCPWCNSIQIRQQIILKDYFLTNEEFPISKCDECSLVFTNPRPGLEYQGLYYKSDRYYSHANNQGGVIPFLYSKIKRINLATKYIQAVGNLSVGKILDIGCGTGDFLDICKSNGWDILGIEPDDKAREITENKLGIGVLNPSQITELFEGSFDLVTMWHVLEHVHDLQFQIEELKRLIKKNGKVVIALPNFKSPDALHYGEYWAAWDVPRHLYHFEREVIINMMKSKGFEVDALYPMKWDAFYVSLLSENYRNKSFSFFRAVLSGFISNWKAKRGLNYSSLVYTFIKS